MSTYRYWTGAGGAGTGADWTNAFTTYAAALAAATSDGDQVLVQYTSQENFGADTTLTYGADITVVSVDKDSSDAYTPMGTNGWIGHSSVSRLVSFAGARNARHVGLTLRSAGLTAGKNFNICATDGASMEWNDCLFWIGNTNAGSGNHINLSGSGSQGYCRLVNCDIEFGSTAGKINVAAATDIYGLTILSSGSAPAGPLFEFDVGNSAGALYVESSDLSHCGSASLVDDVSGLGGKLATFVNCTFGTGYALLASQAVANRSGAHVFAFDCAVGDTHVNIEYQNASGLLTVDTGVYLTAGPAAASWKIVTTSDCSPTNPFVSPWFDKYVSAGSVTPEIEILRDGSAAAYQDDEVAGEWAYKATSGTARTTLVNDRVAVDGSPADQAAGAGLGAWTGEGGTAWSGKLSPGALTINEAGHLRSRVCVFEPSVTVYVDPDV